PRRGAIPPDGPGTPMMRIGIVCPYSWDVPGGVQSHIRDLAESLIEIGHTVSVISPADDDTPLPPYVVPAGRAVPVPYNGSAARTTLVEHIGGAAVLIPNGVATKRFRKADPLPGWPGEGGAIGFLGRIDEPRKGLQVLLKAFEKLGQERHGLRLLIAGPGDEQEALHRVPLPLRD